MRTAVHVASGANVTGRLRTTAANKKTTMKWTDTLDIAVALADKHPDVDPKTVRFTDLLEWVQQLDDFDDDPKRCGEKILEAIKAAWIEEAG